MVVGAVQCEDYDAWLRVVVSSLDLCEGQVVIGCRESDGGGHDGGGDGADGKFSWTL